MMVVVAVEWFGWVKWSPITHVHMRSHVFFVFLCWLCFTRLRLYERLLPDKVELRASQETKGIAGSLAAWTHYTQ